MSEIRNRIITISGEPVSGKSTVIKELSKLYKEQGYEVVIISSGEIFRKKALEEYSKMYPDRKNVSLADIQEDPAFLAKRAEIDAYVDEYIRTEGERINSEENPNVVYIIDSRLAWKYVPNSFAVRLTIDEKEAGKRVFNDKTRGSEDSYETIEQAIEKTRKRKLGEILRYIQRNNADLRKVENYNLIVDTSYSYIEELAKIIISSEELYREGKYYAKYWASPLHFFPLELGKEIKRVDDEGNTIKSLYEDLKNNGYHNTPEEALEISEKDGVKFLNGGLHRLLATLATGRTLVPYVVTNRDNEVEEDEISNLIKSKALINYVKLIKYYGGKIGKIEQLKDLTVKDLLSIDSATGKSQEDDDGER